MTRECYAIFDNMLAQPHLLIAGATGSGKSVVINGMMYNALFESPADVNFILIDPKRVELAAYRNLPHVIQYASEPEDMVYALWRAMQETEYRYTAMQAAGRKTYHGGDLYVIIDELADLMTTNRKKAEPIIQRLCQVGRAARVHVVAATQCPLRCVIPTPILVNMDARVGLRTRSAQDSRNILGVTGCEKLPRYGKGYYMTPEGVELWEIPMYPENQIQELIDAWTPAGQGIPAGLAIHKKRKPAGGAEKLLLPVFFYALNSSSRDVSPALHIANNQMPTPSPTKNAAATIITSRMPTFLPRRLSLSNRRRTCHTPLSSKSADPYTF